MAMMEVKFFEIRDEGTMFPWMAYRMRPVHDAAADGQTLENRRVLALLRRGGFGDEPESYIMQGTALGGEVEFHYDVFYWRNRSEGQRGRTRFYAAKYIEEHYDELESGSVIDVEFILGEKSAPKLPEVAL
jgi:hypothetical protein